jgi:effector-binding domain-containing protein
MTGIILLVAFCVGTIVSLVLPAKQRIERSIVINAPASVVYEHLKSLANVNDWAVWNKRDSTVKNSIIGDDGKIGTAMSWKGDPEISGEGKIVILMLSESKKVKHDILFSAPTKGQAESEFILSEHGGASTVVWEFDVATPRPRNIFNLFSSMDKTLGKDIEEGLKELKAAIEKKAKPPLTKTYKVVPMNFPNTTYATVRQTVNITDMPTFFEAYLTVLKDEAQKAGWTTSTPAGLFFLHDEKNGQADIAAALPVPEGTRPDHSLIQVTDIPASKSLYVDFYGSYDKIGEAHQQLKKYIADQKLEFKPPAIEQYLTDSATEKDTNKWKTRVIYLVQ